MTGYRGVIFAGGLIAAALPAALHAQEAPAQRRPASQPSRPAPESIDDEEDQSIVVEGQRPPGSVVGDIQPEVTLSPADIRSYGVATVSDLLNELAPQTGQAAGGPPIVLLNGKRISSLSEIRDLPTEAILRTEILPEEVALEYGYNPDQKVVNIVLRRRFRAVTGQIVGGTSTDGGGENGNAEGDLVRIRGDARLNIDAKYQRNAGLLESDRDVTPRFPGAPDTARWRSLSPASDTLSLNGVLARPIGDVSATFNGTFDATGGRSLRGLASADTLGVDPLTQRTSGETGHFGTTLNGQLSSKWRWTLTGTYDRAASRTTTMTGIDDPATQTNRAHSLSNAGDVELMLNGQLWRLPAGPISTTIRTGGTLTGFDSSSTRAGLTREASLSRTQGEARIHFDFPLLKRTSPIGAFTANVNAGVIPVSGFGTLDMHGYGFNWRPRAGLSVILSVTDTGSAPTIQQLGNPQVLTPGVRVFDYRTGTTVEVTRLDGGNPNLEAGDRNVFRLGLNWKPLQKTDLTIIANYSRTTTRDTASSLPAPTAAIEAAFPTRFVRDEDGDLIRIDNTPINFSRETRSQLRWGFNFSHRLRSDPRKLIEAYRAAGVMPPARGQFPAGAGGAQRPRGAGGAPGQGDDAAVASRPAGEGAPGAPGAGAPGGGLGGPGGGFGGGPGGPGGGGGRGFGGRGGGGAGAQGGRLQFALYHTWVFRDDILIQPGMPVLDLLDGDALGSSGGVARHKLEGQAGYSNNGLGLRLGANWQSATRVRGGAGSAGNLRFSDLTTLNARFFADLGQIPSLVRHPWARGMRVTLAVDNLFNQRQDVRDAAGNTPVAYQPAYLDPMGRTVKLTIRKLFF